MEYTVYLSWDEESQVWIATSPDILGLVLESGSYDALVDRVSKAIPDLLDLNGLPKAKAINIRKIGDVCYAGTFQENIKVKEVTPLRGGMMIVLFSTGEKRLFDTSLLQGPAFAPLKDEAVVSKPIIFHGVITWDNGSIDVSPEAVYSLSYPYQEDKAI